MEKEADDSFRSDMEMEVEDVEVEKEEMPSKSAILGYEKKEAVDDKASENARTAGWYQLPEGDEPIEELDTFVQSYMEEVSKVQQNYEELLAKIKENFE